MNGKGVKMMRRFLSMALVCVSMISCLCVNAGAVENTEALPENCKEAKTVSMRASGSFNMSIEAHGKGTADKELPLEAGETVRIYATYSPDDASVDFGLIDPDGIFHLTRLWIYHDRKWLFCGRRSPC